MTWIMHEYGVQRELFDDGADVPRPIAQRGNTILMDYVGDDWGPAPTLSEISLAHEEAQPLLDRVLENVRLMLSHHYVHGDLSAYNILYWEGEITIIDFPQMVDARKNQNAYSLLQRDIQRVCAYFVRYGATAHPDELSTDLWDNYINGRM
jgi:RIO kinase 1